MNEVVISNQLVHLGLDPSLKGFRYLVDFLKMIEEVGDPCEIQATMAYRIIAKHFGSTWSRVERNIRTVVNHYYESRSTYHNLLMPDVSTGAMCVSSFVAKLWYIIHQDFGYFHDGSCWAVNHVNTLFDEYEVRIYTAGGNYTAFIGTREECNKYIHKGMKEYVV